MEWEKSGARPINDTDFNRVYEKIEFFSETQYHEYVPCLGPENFEFMVRLGRWIGNVSNVGDKQILCEFVPRIPFFGRAEFTELYQAAFRGPITRWVIDELNLFLNDPGLEDQIANELHHHTWYCPITDSMQISDFHHVNQIGGIDYRPDFRSLAVLGERQGQRKRVVDFMQNHKNATGRSRPLRRIVLLEDFVGRGTQIEDALKFAAELSPDIPILLAPLIICPDGGVYAKQLANNYANVSYGPVMELTDDLFIRPSSKVSPASLEAQIRDLAVSTYSQVVGDEAARPRPYGPFGFRETGATIVMYSNAPANTLPLIQHESNTWKPLFPRSARRR